MSAPSGIRRMPPEVHRKVWGSPDTKPWFQSGDQQVAEDPIGELWFPAGDLLIKFLFTSQHLSIQVHPGDDYARRHHDSRGKTEMWYILRAAPGARIAVGLKEPVSTDDLIEAARSGEIVDLMNWIEVHPGEAYLVPAGTVHAIGAGIALCEIQQNSDVTYRLFDYGRGRELHLQAARDVSNPGAHVGASQPVGDTKSLQLLVECPYFATYRLSVGKGEVVTAGPDTRFLVVCEGRGKINGLNAAPGDVFQRTTQKTTGGTDIVSKAWEIEPEAQPHSGSMKLLLIR